MLATKIFEKIPVASRRTHHGRSEEAQLSSGGISITSELFSLNFNSFVRAEQSFAICYPNVVIESLCGNLDICLNYYANAYFQSQNSVRVLSVADRDRKLFFLIVLFGRALEQFSRFRNRNPFRSRKNRAHGFPHGQHKFREGRISL